MKVDEKELVRKASYSLALLNTNESDLTPEIMEKSLGSFRGLRMDLMNPELRAKFERIFIMYNREMERFVLTDYNDLMTFKKKDRLVIRKSLWDLFMRISLIDTPIGL